MFGDREPDAASNRSYGIDGYCDLPATPPVSFGEKYVGDMAIDRIDDETMYSTDFAVGGVDAFAATDGHFTEWDLVVRNELRDVLRSVPDNSATNTRTEV